MTLRFRFNARKALQVIVWLAHRRPGITLHTILKVLFYADKYHLNLHGRPIIGDDYIAMQWGPVPSATYDILKGDQLALESLNLERVPFTVQGCCVSAEIGPDLDVFSESDIEALEWAFQNYGTLNFGQLTALTHHEKAWQNADGRFMRYEDFLDESDEKDELVEDLREAAPRLVI